MHYVPFCCNCVCIPQRKRILLVWFSLKLRLCCMECICISVSIKHYGVLEWIHFFHNAFFGSERERERWEAGCKERDEKKANLGCWFMAMIIKAAGDLLPQVLIYMAHSWLSPSRLNKKGIRIKEFNFTL